MPKRDYYDDPSAPSANSLVVAVAAVLRDDAGRVLMIKHTDDDLWAIPGGAQNIGETTTAAAVREVREETGLDVTKPVGRRNRRSRVDALARTTPQFRCHGADRSAR